MIVLLVAVVAAPLAAQSAPPAAESEARPTLLPFRLGETGVELSLTGSWLALASFGGGLLSAPASGLQSLDALPGITTGFAFSQVPDLTLSITLLERWFLEVSVLGGTTANMLLAGYRGADGQALRHVTLGTRGITATATPFLDSPQQAKGSLGISALVDSGIGRMESLLRWDVTGELHRTYIGTNELLEQRIALDAWIRGRFFVLPDVNVQDLVVLLEDADGQRSGSDGRSYRVADFRDVVADAAAGRVTLKSEWKGRVLVFYRKGLLSVGDPDPSMGVDALPGQSGGRRDLSAAAVKFDWDLVNYLGEDMVDRKISVAGVGDCLLLWEPADPSPFQAAGTYAYSIAVSSENARLTAFLDRTAGNAAVPTDLQFAFDASRKQVTAYVDPDFRADFRNRYPFYAAPPTAPVNLLYGPDRDAVDGILGFDLLVQALQPVAGYVLGSDVVPASVRVTLNGVEETRFSLDASTGTLTFHVEIASTDRIEVRWRTTSAAVSGGDVLLSWRDDIRLAENLGLWLAAGLRWNVGMGVTAGEPYARSGAVVAAAGIEGSAGALKWSARAAASFSNPDTTGVVRLHGMEGHAIQVDLSEELAWSAAPPADVTGWGYAIAPQKANRGRLLYRDYRSYDAFGGAQLHSIEWPDYRTEAYASGGRAGPYNVLGTSTSSSEGRSLVLEYDLPTAGDWVGAQLPVVAGSLANLSTAKSITLRLRGLDIAGDVQVHLEAGAIGEDLDDDGVLDQEPSATATGFAFNDTGRFPAVLKVGAGPRLQGNRHLDSEDRDGSGTLTDEEPGLVVHEADPAAHRFSGPIADTGWKVATFTLSDADRGRLQQSRSIRLVVEGLTAATGRIQVDLISIAGSAFWAESSTGTVKVREIAEAVCIDDPGAGKRLTDVAPDAMALFHPSGQTEEVLEIAWAGTSTDLTVTGSTSKTTEGIAYDAAVVYVRASGVLGSAASISFSLLDPQNKGIRWSIDAAALDDEAWHELRASRRDGTISLDGAALAGAPTFDQDHGDVGLLKVVVSGSTGGVLFLDEVHLRDPHTAWGAAVAAEASWRRPGVIWKAGSVPLLGNVAVAQDVSFATEGFTSLYGRPIDSASFTSRTRLGADILYARLQADLVLRDVGGSFDAWGSHRITVPAAPSAVSFSDAFSLTGANEFSREDTLRLQLLPSLALSLKAAADGRAEVLTQEWSASLAVQPGARFSLALAAGFSQQAEGYALSDAWYGARWVREAGLLIPWYDGATVERDEYLKTDVAAALGPVRTTLSVDASLAGTEYATLSRSQEDVLATSWSLSWPLGSADGAAITVRYARSLLMSGVRDAGNPFTAEAGDYVRLLGAQRYCLLGLPVVEILHDDSPEILADWEDLVQATWEPSLRIALERRPGSRISDLFLPATADLTISRRFEKTSDLFQNEIRIVPRIATHALNLFGALGSHPLMRFYRTDEYTISLSGEVSGSVLGDLSLSALALELNADVLGFRDQAFTLVNLFALTPHDGTDDESLEVKESLQAAFDWTTRPDGGVRLPYLPEPIARTGFLRHRESLELSMALSSEPSHPLTLLLGHATSIVYPDRGSLKAGLKAGFDVESMSGAYALRFAVEAGLEIKLSF